MIDIDRISKVYEIVKINKLIWSTSLEKDITSIISKNDYKIIKKFLKDNTIILVLEKREK